MENKIFWYEVCFYGYERSERTSEDECAYVIKTEIPPDISMDTALKILFGENPKEDWMKELIPNCTCVREISANEAEDYAVENLTKRVESKYGVYYSSDN